MRYVPHLNPLMLHRRRRRGRGKGFIKGSAESPLGPGTMKAPDPVHFLGCLGTASCDQGVTGTSSLLRSALDVAQYSKALMESDSINGLMGLEIRRRISGNRVLDVTEIRPADWKTGSVVKCRRY